MKESTKRAIEVARRCKYVSCIMHPPIVELANDLNEAIFQRDRALELLRKCVEMMEMQEKRETGEFHLSVQAFAPLWKKARDDARALLAEADG